MESKRRRELRSSPQVKVCGLTRVDEAIACAELGADAIGLIFYPPSPRFVTEGVAREITSAISGKAHAVGVFVNEPLGAVLLKVQSCGLSAVQLHGIESPGLVESLMEAGVKVIKTVFVHGKPAITDALPYAASAYLVENGGGRLPGGNAQGWDWSVAAAFALDHPCILAGGLDPGNVESAIDQARPDAVDVSSGVEFAPGRKDMSKVKAFIEAALRKSRGRCQRRIF